MTASSGLNPDQVQGLVEDAERYRSSDDKRRELAELNNAAEALLYTSTRAVDECAELVDASLIQTVREDIQHLQQSLAENADAITIRQALQALEVSAYKVAESMYGTDDESIG